MLFTAGLDITPLAQIRNSAGDRGLVFGAESAELGSSQAPGIVVQVEKAGNMNALQAEFGHFRILDPLDKLIAHGNSGDEVLETLYHGRSSFL
jgi:hypothetical protein